MRVRAGVVDEDVNPSESLERGRGEHIGVGFGGDVHTDRQRGVPLCRFIECRRRGLGVGDVEVGDDDLRAFRAQLGRIDAADAVGTAGHDHDAVLESHRHLAAMTGTKTVPPMLSRFRTVRL